MFLIVLDFEMIFYYLLLFVLLVFFMCIDCLLLKKNIF